LLHRSTSLATCPPTSSVTSYSTPQPTAEISIDAATSYEPIATASNVQEITQPGQDSREGITNKDNTNAAVNTGQDNGREETTQLSTGQRLFVTPEPDPLQDRPQPHPTSLHLDADQLEPCRPESRLEGRPQTPIERVEHLSPTLLEQSTSPIQPVPKRSRIEKGKKVSRRVLQDHSQQRTLRLRSNLKKK